MSPLGSAKVPGHHEVTASPVPTRTRSWVSSLAVTSVQSASAQAERLAELGLGLLLLEPVPHLVGGASRVVWTDLCWSSTTTLTVPRRSVRNCMGCSPRYGHARPADAGWMIRVDHTVLLGGESSAGVSMSHARTG